MADEENRVVGASVAAAAQANGTSNGESKSNGNFKDGKKAGESKEKKVDERFVAERGTGLVKSVVGGDTIVVLQIDAQARHAPKERRIALSNLVVPDLAQPKRVQISQAQRRAEKEAASATKATPASFDEQSVELKSDEPFAFASREFLRRLVVGKQVTFVVEAKFPGRDYGFVFLPSNRDDADPVDVSLAMVKAGYARVRDTAREDPRPGMEAYLDAEDEAAAAGLGLHTTDKNARRKAIRALADDSSVDYSALAAKYQGKEIDIVVEVVRTASSFRVILPSSEEVNVLLSGIEAPERGAAFDKESKFFAEAIALQRDAKLTIEGADKSSFYGTVLVEGRNVAEELLRAGLARFVEWSAVASKSAKQLRQAELAARQGRVRLFAGGAKAAEKPVPRGVKREVVGKVTEISSAGQIVVTDTSGNQHKIFLSSIRVPRAPRFARGGKAAADVDDGEADGKEDGQQSTSRAEQEAQLWIEGKEALRRELISKRVRCVLDYVREMPTRGGDAASSAGAKKPSAEPELRGMYSVYSLDNKHNVAVALVDQGLAFAIQHRGAEDRSKDYADLISAEAAAKSAKRGVWAAPESMTTRRSRDLTSADLAECKQFFPFLKRAGRSRGVVEFEFSPSKLKVYIPKEDTTIALSLTGVRTPLMKLPNKERNPLAVAALKRVAELCHQQEIEFDVLAQDRTGGFIGNVFLARDKIPLAVRLLEEGLASIHRPSLAEVPNERDFEIAEEGAKKKRLGVWETYDPEVEEAKRQAARAERAEQNKPKQELHDVVVTEIIDGSRFFVQIVSNEVKQLEKLMSELQAACADAAATATSTADFKPNRKLVCAGQFTADDHWYRARIQQISGEGADMKCVVQYVDYGNTEELPLSRLRPLGAAFTSLPHQAVAAQLAYIKVPAVDQDFGEDAAQFLADFTHGKTLMANVEYRDAERMYLSLGDRDSQEHVGAAMLRAGLAQVERRRGSRWETPIKAKLREEEDKARHARVGLFTHGDPGDSDDEL